MKMEDVVWVDDQNTRRNGLGHWHKASLSNNRGALQCRWQSILAGPGVRGGRRVQSPE